MKCARFYDLGLIISNIYFLASSELLLPESDFESKKLNFEEDKMEHDGELNAKLEIRSALQKIPIQIPTFNVLGMISHKKSQITIFGHKNIHLLAKFT